MAGLTVPTVGRCLLDGAPVSDQVGAVAISFQAARLQLMRSRVDHEIASTAGFSRHNRARIEEALGTVGLDPALATRRIDQLSGGQMRRVVLAGLLARSPRALILDEPLAGLDAESQEGLVGLLEDLRRRKRLTVVVISHDFGGLENLCPRTLHMADGMLAPAPTSAGECHDRAPQAAPRDRAAATGAGPHRDPRAVGRFETADRRRHRRAADFLSGLGSDRGGGAAHRNGRQAGPHPAWGVAHHSALAVGTAGARWRHRGVRRR